MVQPAVAIVPSTPIMATLENLIGSHSNGLTTGIWISKTGWLKIWLTSHNMHVTGSHTYFIGHTINTTVHSGHGYVTTQ